MNAETAVRVQAYSGHTYPQRPLAFNWDGRRREVAHIEAEWHTPQGKAFRVRTPSGWRCQLIYRADLDDWHIEV